MNEDRDMDVSLRDSTGPLRHSRRSLMAGAVTAGAGIAASVMISAQPAGASDANPLLLGESNTAGSSTTLTNDGSDGTTADGLDVTAGTGDVWLR